ncbi:MAG TPA: glycosyltransferase [Thermodesulfobacterium commune]|jgi:UDP-N-acetylmuramyl pentapeptide phosphotransferase/UDP-N-acetylglucosamine-1-phosphate transferase|uniref:MraY family glycosyltransferase n=1 Tax=Thermodesulfobacterium commune TaxID=1741 RepID=UPI000E9D0A48|nr:glycosyltransferase [Thermodesulfobacterium commune]HCE79334.1 glycosyltransferase [Thermodesulfobacterium commune]
MLYLIIAFLTSFFTCFFLIKKANEAFIDDQVGVQKFHQWNAVRVGGLPIIFSLIAVSIAFTLTQKDFAKLHILLVVSSIPVFLGGFIEDLTKKVGPKIRLFCGMFSGFLVYLFLGETLIRVDLPGFDYLLANYLLFSVLFTAFALAGVANAINIIDGFNGLASGVSIMVFLSYAYVSFLVGDMFLVYTSLTIASAIFGFFFWNFPFGYIFLGDGGAYLLGFLAGLIGVLLVERHQEVSAWFPLLLLLYPIYETIFSITRKKFIRNSSPFEPDAVHLHMLIHRRVIKLTLGNKIPNFLLNSLTSPYLWFMQLLCTIPAVLFWEKTYILISFSLAFIVFYKWLYFRIVNFRTPKIMMHLLKKFNENP